MDVEFGIACPVCEDVLASAFGHKIDELQPSALGHRVLEPMATAFGGFLRYEQKCTGVYTPRSALGHELISLKHSYFGHLIEDQAISAFGYGLATDQEETGEWVPDILMNGPDLSMKNELSTAVLISLMTDRRSRADDQIPDGSDPRGWWADAMDGQQIGSRLWLLDRARNLPETLRLAESYIKEALQWLVDDGAASRVTVACSATRGCSNTLDMLIGIEQPQTSTLQFTWRYAWDLRELRQC